MEKKIMKSEDGTYRWRYDVNLLREFSVLLIVLKVLAISFGAVWLLTTLFSLGVPHYFWSGFLSELKVFAIIFAAAAALGVIAYFIYALIMGGRYCVEFEMTDKYIRHTQIEEQADKAAAVGAVTALAGAFTRKASVIGTGIISGTRYSMTTEFAKVKEIKVIKKQHTVRLRAGLKHNRIYVPDEDMDFVAGFIRERAVNLKK